MSAASILELDTATAAEPAVSEPAVLQLVRPRALQQRIVETVTEAYAALGVVDQPDSAAPLEVRVDGALDAVLDALQHRRRPGPRRCRELIAALRGTRDDLAGAEAARLLERQAGVRAALARLRAVAELDRMLCLMPAELCRCGFSRAWVVRLSDSNWKLASVHASDGPAVLPAGGPQQLTPGSHEAEMVRRRCALIATGEQAEPGLAAVLAPRSYVTAPILVDSRAVGFVGADAGPSGRAMTAADREALALFAEAIGPALQRVVLLARLERLRAGIRRMTHSVGETLDDACWSAIDLGDPPADASVTQSLGDRPAATSAPARESRLTSLLTPRELEVLRLMAGGETNAGIAGQLVISEGTVKSHVKHILRKLHASNRAQAVSRYMRLVHAGPRPAH